MKRTLVWLAVLLGACGAGKEKLTQLPEPDVATKQGAAVRVTTERVQSAPIERPVRAQGTTEPVRAANLGPQLTARVSAVLVREGDAVKAGQPLVRMDASGVELRAQQNAASTSSIESQYALAVAEYERLAPLSGQGSITPQQIERLAAQRDALKSSVQMAKAAQASDQRDLTNAVVRAPFSGIVSHVDVEAGEVATMTPVKVLVRLVDLSQLDVRVRVHERELPRVVVGGPARATFASTGEAEQGTVIFISPEIDPSTRSAEVVVRIENPRGTLRAGMSAQVELRSEGGKSGLVVPTRAVGGAGDDRFVFTVAKGRARRTRVRVAPIDEARQEVLEGLTAEEVVAVDGVARLADGMAVEAAAPAGKAAP